MYLVREKWSKQKSRRLVFRGLWPWEVEYNECSVSGCLFTLPLLHTIGIHQQWPGSAVASIAKHHLVSKKFKVDKMLKCSKCMQEMLSFNWTSWISNFTHYTNFIARSPFNMDPKLSFILSGTFCLHYSDVKGHRAACFGVTCALGKQRLALSESSAHTVQQLGRRLGWH